MKKHIEDCEECQNFIVGCVNLPLHKRGDRFFHKDGEEYILASVDEHQMVLVCIEDGNRWSQPVKVKKHLEVTKEEFAKITNHPESEFRKKTK